MHIDNATIPPSTIPVVIRRRLLDAQKPGAGPESSKRFLLENLCIFDDSQRGDDRDRIYALLSVSRDQMAFEIDYSINADSVYYRAATRIVNRHKLSGTVALLVSAIVHSRRSTQHEDALLSHNITGDKGVHFRGPMSWVPDWRNKGICVTWDEEQCVAVSLSKLSEPETIERPRPIIKVLYKCLLLVGHLFPPCTCAVQTRYGTCRQCHENPTPGEDNAERGNRPRKYPGCLCTQCMDEVSRTWFDAYRNYRRNESIYETGLTLCVLDSDRSVVFLLSKVDDRPYTLFTCLLWMHKEVRDRNYYVLQDFDKAKKSFLLS